LPRSPIPEYDEKNKANQFDKGSLPKVKDSFNLDDEARVKLDLQESEKFNNRRGHQRTAFQYVCVVMADHNLSRENGLSS